jgi:hypothetical protein
MIEQKNLNDISYSRDRFCSSSGTQTSHVIVLRKIYIPTRRQEISSALTIKCEIQQTSEKTWAVIILNEIQSHKLDM